MMARIYNLKLMIHAENCNTILIVLRDYEATEILKVISNNMIREYNTIVKRENHFDESDNVKIVNNIINRYSPNIQLRYTSHKN